MNKTTKTANNKIDVFLKDFFSLLKAEASYEISNADDGIVNITIKTNGSLAGLLIGNKGRNLYSLQSIINLIAKNSSDVNKYIVDIDGWREKDNERLKALAEKTCEKVLSSGESQTLYNLSSSQRRIVHLHLSGNSKIKTESFGEGEERYMIVSPAAQTSNKNEEKN